MRERGNGSIVNVSSLAGIFPLPFMSVYSGSKAGLSAFTQSLILTEQHRGIVLIDFQPGDYRTAFNKSMQQAANLTEQEAQTWNILEKNCLNGPAAEGAARDILRAIRRGSSGVVRSGTFFQRTMAPFARRLVSARMMRRIMRILYKIRE
jgi:short-subunit dehydrogenase